MMWFTTKRKTPENVLRFRTLNRNIRVWMERTKDGPSAESDYAEVGNWVHAHKAQIDAEDLVASAERISQEFPRACCVEVHTGSMTAGIVYR
jgi:hypothetical protein